MPPFASGKTDKVLTDADIEAMADEAECDYDVEVLKARRRDRDAHPALAVELWVDDHQECEPGVVTAHPRHARVPLDPHPGDYLVVGDDEVPPALAKVLTREPDGTLCLRILPGRPIVTPSSTPGGRPRSPDYQRATAWRTSR
jgi:hypothetical protein